MSNQPLDSRVATHGNCWAKHWTAKGYPNLLLPIGLGNTVTAIWGEGGDPSYKSSAKTEVCISKPTHTVLGNTGLQHHVHGNKLDQLTWLYNFQVAQNWQRMWNSQQSMQSAVAQFPVHRQHHRRLWQLYTEQQWHNSQKMHTSH